MNAFILIIGWIIGGIAILAYTGWQAVREWDAQQNAVIAALVLGGVLGVAVAIIMAISTRKMIAAANHVSFTAHLFGGFALQIIGLAVIFAAAYLVRGEDGSFLVEPTIGLFGYYGLVILGFAWRTKLIEGARTSKGEKRDTPPPPTGNDVK